MRDRASSKVASPGTCGGLKLCRRMNGIGFEATDAALSGSIELSPILLAGDFLGGLRRLCRGGLAGFRGDVGRGAELERQPAGRRHTGQRGFDDLGLALVLDRLASIGPAGL